MSQPYSHIRLPLATVNRMKIKNLIRDPTNTKYFSFYEKYYFDFITMLSGTILSFNSLILSIWSFEQIVEICTLTNFLLFYQSLSR